MKNKNILFRANSSFDIGTGHIMRDLVLAKKYSNAHIIFATENLDGNINHKIIEDGYKVHLLNSNNIEELAKYILDKHINLLIIDNYSIDYNFEKELKEKTNVEILSFDDTYEKHYCDSLLNHNIYGDISKYEDLVPENCTVQCGIQYTLLRDEFLNLNIQKKSIEKNDKLKVFIAMGGADSKNMNIHILEEIKKLNLNIELVTTRANTNLRLLEEYIYSKTNITLHIDSKNIADIIKGCDIAIVTPSVMVNEIIFFQMPFISIMVTDNQKYMHAFLKKKEIPCLKNTELKYLNEYIEKLYNPKDYNNQVEIIKNIINESLFIKDN
ncbi:MAG: UDP-2,4-diacetamido-2,4, 6-trideoxy-beta-L-altropyranose hydrolase [uncultured Sulfurovum sp.]|uniref:UDP-2,4-diacetamido-2,4, 6-trideoxy-beta-L-altropyranose hydrolase n=1 Tax=uncultured Sulfurovum sp. TaxID=269237 RepID=A0A6S6S1Z8_9BACT|nr:MAG: UDP-2,4-diacetamido-2,4, 6-trideoxy-beta-L-altropyranose hydrolase [uncultured Sulfurovum sp.]